MPKDKSAEIESEYSMRAIESSYIKEKQQEYSIIFCSSHQLRQQTILYPTDEPEAEDIQTHNLLEQRMIPKYLKFWFCVQNR